MKTQNFSRMIFLSLAATVLMTSIGLSSVAGANDNNDFSHVDPNGIVPSRPKEQALAYFKKNRSDFSNQKVITVVDFTQGSSKKRFYIIDIETGSVTARLTSHGRGSDPNNDGKAESFSNNAESHKSSVGFYRTLNTYRGGHGYSMKLQGLSSTNDNALDRDIVVHPANYINESVPHAGRSYGCPALDPKFSRAAINKIKGGSLLYIWSGQ